MVTDLMSSSTALRVAMAVATGPATSARISG